MRRIPIEFPPAPGEALDSWLLAYAARLQTPLGDLTDGLGIGTVFVTQPAVLVALGRPLPDLTRLVEATRLPAAALEALWGPLARYAALMERRFGYRRIARAARPMLWSRFCKPCLTETGGRWATTWRLPWWVACPTHRSLLSSACPTCGQRQRQGRLLHDLEPDPTTCSMPPAGGAGRGDRRCGADLTEGSISTPVNPLALDAQNRLAVLADHAATERSIAAAADELADLLTLASRTGLDFETLDPEGLSDTSALAKAWHQPQIVLSETTGNALTALALADVRKRPHPLPRRWHTASTALTSKVLSLRDPHLRPVDRLRWRTTVRGRRPNQPDNDPFSRALPWALWPDWSVRLHPRTAVEFSSFRSMAAAALALPGSSRRVEDVVTGRDEDPAVVARQLSHVLQAVVATDHGRAILRALTQLSDGLRTHGSPIDYQRRRHIATTAPPLDLPAWDRICAAAGTPTGGHRKLRHARLWIWETLTGGLPQQAPAALRPENSADPSGYHAFALRLPAIAVTYLEAHARSVLDSHGCADDRSPGHHQRHGPTPRTFPCPTSTGWTWTGSPCSCAADGPPLPSPTISPRASTTFALSSAETPASPCCQDRAEGPRPLAERSARCPPRT